MYFTGGIFYVVHRLYILFSSKVVCFMYFTCGIFYVFQRDPTLHSLVMMTMGRV